MNENMTKELRKDNEIYAEKLIKGLSANVLFGVSTMEDLDVAEHVLALLNYDEEIYDEDWVIGRCTDEASNRGYISDGQELEDQIFECEKELKRLKDLLEACN